MFLIGKVAKVVTSTHLGKRSSNQQLVPTPRATPRQVIEARQGITSLTKVFGVPLEESIAKQHDPNYLPLVMSQCIAFLDDKALDEQGLYRVPGRKNRTSLIKAQFDCGQIVTFDTFEESCTVASLLLCYLREIPGTIFSTEGVLRLRAIRCPDEVERAAQVREVVKTIPEVNRRCMAAMMRHLSRVERRRSANLMNAQNLAMCVFPYLQNPGVAMVMITRCLEIFEDVPVFGGPDIGKNGHLWTTPTAAASPNTADLPHIIPRNRHQIQPQVISVLSPPQAASNSPSRNRKFQPKQQSLLRFVLTHNLSQSSVSQNGSPCSSRSRVSANMHDPASDVDDGFALDAPVNTSGSQKRNSMPSQFTALDFSNHRRPKRSSSGMANGSPNWSPMSSPIAPPDEDYVLGNPLPAPILENPLSGRSSCSSVMLS